MLGFNLNHEGICQGCEAGKHTRGPFPSSETQTIDILQLVHYDLSGMIPVILWVDICIMLFLWMTYLEKHGSIS